MLGIGVNAGRGVVKARRGVARGLVKNGYEEGNAGDMGEGGGELVNREY